MFPTNYVKYVNEHFVKWLPQPSGAKPVMAQYAVCSELSVYMCAKFGAFITKCTM